jgi:hypothetical protein
MRHIRSLVGCITIALAAAAHAQSMESLPAGMPDLAAPVPAGAAMPSGPSARSVFVGTIAALLAQGLGNALSQGIGGSITRWFNRAPPGEVRAPQAMAMPMQRDPVAGGAPHAGVAFEVHAMAPDGTTRVVDPAQHVFHTGDQFQVHYRPTLPGRIEVFNINPRGNESRVDTVEVAAGQLAALGPYRFVDSKGLETLKLVLAPCSSPALAAQTRAIVKVGAAPGAAATPPALRIAGCGDPRMRGIGAKTRTITRTTLDGSTAFALDPLSRSELTSGLIGAREVRIALQHR